MLSAPLMEVHRRKLPVVQFFSRRCTGKRGRKAVTSAMSTVMFVKVYLFVEMPAGFAEWLNCDFIHGCGRGLDITADSSLII
jgi:hypothetical protein